MTAQEKEPRRWKMDGGHELKRNQRNGEKSRVVSGKQKMALVSVLAKSQIDVMRLVATDDKEMISSYIYAEQI